jgi:hypothetical protein
LATLFLTEVVYDPASARELPLAARQRSLVGEVKSARLSCCPSNCNPFASVVRERDAATGTLGEDCAPIGVIRPVALGEGLRCVIIVDMIAVMAMYDRISAGSEGYGKRRLSGV